MRSLISLVLSLVFFGTAGYLVFFIYEGTVGDTSNTTENTSFKADRDNKAVRAYPGSLQLKSEDGREIEATLLARNASYIHFERTSDRGVFVYPIALLDAESREEVLLYPDTGIEQAEDFLSDGSLELDDVYVEQLRTAIKRLNEKIEQNKSLIQHSTSKTDRRTYQREIESMREEQQEIRNKIKERILSN